MIQPHDPPFGFRSIASALLGRVIRVQDLEDTYSEQVGIPGVVWLPSARSGICWSLRAAIAEGTPVMTPAFTCPAVHEAVVRSGGQLEPLDVPNAGFLLDPQCLARRTVQSHAIVLSAVYGHSYDPSAISPLANTGAVLRVMDMAMSMPEWDLLSQLCDRDFAVISFSHPKSMEAGYGAIGLTRDVELAREVRRLRDAALVHAGLKPLLARLSAASLRTLLSHRWINSIARQARSRRPKDSPIPPASPGIPPAWRNGTRFDGAVSSTRLDRGLALRNLIHSDIWRQARVARARRYRQNLAGARGILLPEFSSQALSHFTIRVPGPSRTLLRQRLYDAGIESATLWRFPNHLEPDKYPNAHRLSVEVVNLPLSVSLTDSDVDRICDLLRRSAT